MILHHWSFVNNKNNQNTFNQSCKILTFLKHCRIFTKHIKIQFFGISLNKSIILKIKFILIDTTQNAVLCKIPKFFIVASASM